MFFLIDETGRIVRNEDYDRLLFDSQEAAQTWANENEQIDWMIVEFKAWT